MESTDARGMLQDVVMKLKARRNSLKTALDQTEAEIHAVETTMRLLTQNGSRVSHLAAIFNETPYDFKKKTQKECLIEIARKNEGIVKVAEAKRILTTAGVLKKGRNAWGAIYTTLTRAKEFEKSASGEFRLVNFGPRETVANADDRFQFSESASAVVTKAQ